MTLQQYEPPMVIDSTSAHQINQALAYINGIGSTLGPFLKNDIFKGSENSTKTQINFCKRLKIYKITIQ